MCVNECTYVYECTNVCLLLYILHMYVCIFMYTCVNVMCMCTYVVHVCPFCTITLGFLTDIKVLYFSMRRATPREPSPRRRVRMLER